MAHDMLDAKGMNAELLLQGWLEPRLDSAGAQWLRESVSSLAGGRKDRELFGRVSLVSRTLGKAPLDLDAAALASAESVRAGWDPSNWSIDQAARIRLLLAAATDIDTFVHRLDQLCATADVDELVAFYRGLPVYPDPPRHRLRAAEGLRSNMKIVFEAVAHRNPYPAEQLPEDAWNQMVLKALFVGSALDPIVGLDRRANATLARMLGDYAHERWAARRSVNPELWRCVGPFATGRLLGDFGRLLETGSPPERAAAVLALRTATDPEAGLLLERHAVLRDIVAARAVDWKSALEFN
jgi:hypothetical protein